MAEFFSYDPITGLRRDFDYDEATGNAHIITSQDVSAAIDHAKFLANTGATDKGIKEGFWHYAILPEVVQIELMNRGLNPFSKDEEMMTKIKKVIRSEYPWCLTTTKSIV